MGGFHLTPEQVLNTHQPLRTDQVIRLLENYGFEQQPSNGGSHIHFIHPASGETAGVIRQTEKIDTQQQAAKACLLVQAWEEDRKKEKLVKKFAQQAHEEPKQTDLQLAEEALPDHLSVSIVKGQEETMRIVRDKEYPQIGTVCRPEICPQRAAEIIQEIADKKTAFLNSLDNLESNYEYKIEKDKSGQITVTHRIYDIDPILLNKYSPFHSEDRTASGQIRQIIAFTENLDTLISSPTKTYISEMVPDRKPVRTLNNGNTVWALPHTHFLNPDLTITLELETSPQGRISAEKFISFKQAIYEFERGSQTDKKRLKNILKEKGVELKTNPEKKHELVGISVFSKQQMFCLAPPYETPPLTDIFLDETLTDEEALSKLTEIVNGWEIAKKDMFDAICAQNREIEAATELYHEMVREIDSLHHSSYNLRTPHPGDIIEVILSHPAFAPKPPQETIFGKKNGKAPTTAEDFERLASLPPDVELFKPALPNAIGTMKVRFMVISLNKEKQTAQIGIFPQDVAELQRRLGYKRNTEPADNLHDNQQTLSQQII